MVRNVADWERLVSIGLGAALVAGAIARRRALSAAAVAGAGLIVRGASGHCPVYGAAGLSSRETGRPRLAREQHRHLVGTVTINRSAREVYEFWRALEHLPSIFKGLDQVERLDERYTRWSWRGPAGVRFEWMAEMTESAPDRLSWRSLPGADLDTSGTVRFTDLARGGCEVIVTMDYNQPGGSATGAALWMIGRTPKGELREDLRRLKQVLETGELPIGGQPSGKRTGTFRAMQTVAS